MKDRRLTELPEAAWDSIPGLVLNGCSRLECLHFLPLTEPEQVEPFALCSASEKFEVVTGGVPIDTMPGGG
jgi:hypothetical protein